MREVGGGQLLQLYKGDGGGLLLLQCVGGGGGELLQL